MELRDGRNLGGTVGMLACFVLGVGMLPVSLPLRGGEGVLVCVFGVWELGWVFLLDEFEGRCEGVYCWAGGLMGVLEFEQLAVAVFDVVRC